MKTSDLIHSLTRTEKSNFQKVIDSKKKGALSKLYQYLWKTPQRQVTKEKMYKATYGRAFTKDKDYLLRNDLRLLTEELSTYIINHEIEDNLKKNTSFKDLWYLRALRKRSLPDLFDEEYERLYVKANKNQHVRVKEEMAYERLMEYYARLDKGNLSEEVFASGTHYLNDLQSSIQLHVREAEIYQLIALRRWNIDPTKDNVKPPEFARKAAISLLPEEDDHPLTRYYYHFSVAMETNKGERLRHLQEALRAIEQYAGKDVDQLRLKSGCINFMAITYNEMGEYDQHLNMFKQALLLLEENNQRPTTPVHNYLMGLIAHNKLELFWEEFTYYKDWFVRGGQTYVPNTLLMYAHLADHQYDKAMEHLNKMKIDTDQDYLMHKSTLTQIYYLQGLYDLVDREADNVLKFIWNREKDARYETYQLQSKLFKLLTRIKVAPKKEQKVLKKKVSELINETGDDSLKWMIHTFPHFKWLMSEVEEL